MAGDPALISICNLIVEGHADAVLVNIAETDARTPDIINMSDNRATDPNFEGTFISSIAIDDPVLAPTPFTEGARGSLKIPVRSTADDVVVDADFGARDGCFGLNENDERFWFRDSGAYKPINPSFFLAIATAHTTAGGASNFACPFGFTSGGTEASNRIVISDDRPFKIKAVRTFVNGFSLDVTCNIEIMDDGVDVASIDGITGTGLFSTTGLAVVVASGSTISIGIDATASSSGTVTFKTIMVECEWQ